MSAGYANDVFYSLANGFISEVPRNNWHIAFSVDAQSSAILINEAASVELKSYPIGDTWTWDDDLDITEFDNWDNLLNPDTTWADGAFGMNATGHPNYGWGNYNMATHNVEGVALYIIKYENDNGENFKKIFIDAKYSSLKKYDFKYANIDGTMENVVTLDVSDSNANFVYYSLEDNLRLNREPDKESWDLLFTKFKDNDLNYDVTGVFSNIDILVIEKGGTDFDNATWTDEEYSDDINIIGYDWKAFNMDLMVYEVDEEKVYILKDRDDTEFLLNFSSFDYGSGKFVFTTQEK
jgi:hypothetical protein